MGLTKEQLSIRSKKKLYEYLDAHGVEVTHSKTIKKVWDRQPVCAQDICVFHAILTRDGGMMFTDYDIKNDTYPENFCRTLEQLKREDIDSIYRQISTYDAKHTKNKKS